jgi:hypothetical protein
MQLKLGSVPLSMSFRLADAAKGFDMFNNSRMTA